MYRNYIATLKREMEFDNEFIEFYNDFENEDIKLILSTLHTNLVNLFNILNERLPTYNYTAHFWADPSRDLINAIQTTLTLQRKLKNTIYAFEIEEYNKSIIEKCKSFLQPSGGSTIPENMDKIDLYYAYPIFKKLNNITVTSPNKNFNAILKPIGSGSYANTYSYIDEFYNRTFAIKQAKKDLNEKELARFKQEFEIMNNLKSPYVVEVFKYNELKNCYIMEYMDYSLDKYIYENNSSLNISKRKNMVLQILKAFEYIHSKKILHRDISPKNILIKIYDDVIVIKIADFGLVKIPESELTSTNTEFKGYFNDPCLKLEGFSTYNLLHEIYALTMTIIFIMSGKTNVSKISDSRLQTLIKKGLNPDKKERYQSLLELKNDFLKLYAH